MTSYTFFIAVATVASVFGSATIAYKLVQFKTKRRQVKLPQTWTKVGKLKHLYIYPVKSCAPVVVQTAETALLGLRNGWCRDRTLMVIDKNNHFVNARTFKELFRVQPSFEGSVLTLRHPDAEPCSINLAGITELNKRIQATVWGVKVEVLGCGFGPQEWLSRILDKTSDSFRLVLWSSEKPRGLRGSYVAPFITEDDPGAFPDETSYNIINQASVDDLNTRLASDGVTHRHFRPTLVVTGPEAYAEDQWKFIKIGDSVLEVLKPCLRCIMTTMDPDTGKRNTNGEPLKTLESYRLLPDLRQRKAFGLAPSMGLQLALRSGTGNFISLGDDVLVA